MLTDQAVQFLVPKGIDASQLTFQTNFKIDELTAPFDAGTKTGTVTYTYQMEGKDTVQEKTVNLVTAEKMEEGGWFRLLLRSIRDVFSSLF